MTGVISALEYNTERTADWNGHDVNQNGPESKLIGFGRAWARIRSEFCQNTSKEDLNA